LNTTAIHTSFYPARFKDNGDGTYKFISLTASAMGIGDLGYFEDLQFGKKYNNLLNLFIEKNTSFISFILKENLEKICNIAGFLYENNKAPQKYDVIKITDKDISGLGPDEAIIFLPIVKTQLKLNAYKTCIFIKNTSKHSKRYFGDYQEDKLSKDYEFLSYTFPLGHNPSEVYMTGFSNECHDIAAAMKLKMVAGQASFFGNTVTWQIPDGEIKTASGELHAYELSKESYKEKKRLLDKG
jgi:hypothetical protein